MKRHLWPVVYSALLVAAPSMAQEPYHPTYGNPGYSSEPSYDSNRDNRSFNFNPGGMMNRMPNPMNSMFGSSRRYDAYPGGRYTRPDYPPAYGYPRYPAYPPASGYGYENPSPAYGVYPDIHGQPQAKPARPDIRQAPEAANSTPPAPATNRTPAFRPTPGSPAPGEGNRYRFRPMENPPSASTPAETQAPYQQPLPPRAEAPAYTAPAPAAQGNPPMEATQGQSETGERQSSYMHEGKAMKFRPLDKPGSAPDVNQ